MNWFDELDEEQQQQWHDRVARKRLDLSASVEETLLDGMAQEGRLADEFDDSTVVPASKDATLIPPRLSLQSKPLPAVRPQTAASAKSLSNPSVSTEQGAMAKENASIIARFAQRISSSLASLGGAPQPALSSTLEGKQRVPAIDRGVQVQPAEQAGLKEFSPHPQMLAAKMTVSRSTETSQPAQSKQRLTHRTTKVRLQVVPRPEAAEMPLERASLQPLYEASTNPNIPTTERLEIRAGTIAHEARAGLSGSGMFESGQSDVAIANTHITPSSVVIVMLTSDPGPVVVQYVSLQQKLGFTVHLSAPTQNVTPFNYRIL